MAVKKAEKKGGEYKQVVLVRDDIKMSPGKIAAQVSHACVDTVLKSDKETVAKWRAQGMKKVVLKVNNDKDLFDFHKKANKEKIVCSLVTDAGRTEISSGTITCLGIGPDKADKIDKLTGKLKLF